MGRASGRADWMVAASLPHDRRISLGVLQAGGRDVHMVDVARAAFAEDRNEIRRIEQAAEIGLEMAWITRAEGSAAVNRGVHGEHRERAKRFARGRLPHQHEWQIGISRTSGRKMFVFNLPGFHPSSRPSSGSGG